MQVWKRSVAQEFPTRRFAARPRSCWCGTLPALEVPALEVFVMRRTPRAVFGPGATVFPGGAVDASDAQALAHVVGADDAAASAELGLTDGGLVRRVAAVRECFEEAGILLARDRATGAPATPAPEWRDALNAGHATLGQVLARDALVIDATDLRVFAHWLTPTGAPRRYDTWFFVARAPDGQDGAHDDAELVASEWIRPPDALGAPRARGDRTDPAHTAQPAGARALLVGSRV